MQIRNRKPALRRNPRGSCTECFKRKKKCDKDQPCYNCTRRYPPVECIYQKLESLPGDETEPTLRPLAKSLYEESAAGPVLSSSDESSLSPEEAKPNPSGDALQLVPQKSISLKNEMFCKIESNEDSNAEYAQFKARLVIQKFSKLSKLGCSLGCGTLDLLRMLSVEGTSNNADFFDTHNKLMTRYDYSIDGSGKAPELYEKAWIPFTINSPLLLHLNLLKAAIARCQPWLPETNFEKAFLYYSPPSEPSNQAAVIRLRLRALSLLKARLRSPVLSIDDESIAAACYMIYLEWTWNDVTKEFTGLMPHVKGLREMLRQRGGLDKLGQSTVLATVVMLAHYHLATNLECDPFVVPTALLRDKFTPDHKPRMRGIDSPLWISTGSFAEKLPTSGLHPSTARILDWMSFLTAQIRSSVLNDTSEARHPQIMLSASRIYAQLAELPSAATDEPLRGGDGGGVIAGDFIYEAVRLASLVYTRAIMHHIKLSQSCSADALSALLEATSRVPLRKWKEMPGIWLFILLVANAGARFTREGRLSRALTRICSFSITLRDWQTMVNLMESFLAVQKWIAERGCA